MILQILTSASLVLTAIVSLAMMAWIPKPARLLAALGLALVLAHAVWNLLDRLFLWKLAPGLLLQIMFFVSYAALVGGFVLLVLAATARPKPASQAAPHGQPPHPPAPHGQPPHPPAPHGQPAPAAPSPPPAPNPGGTPGSADPHPGT